MNTSERILEQIKDRLFHYNLEVDRIKLEVDNGEVILRGKVDSHGIKSIAEDIALAVVGVKEVHNYLQVEAGGKRLESNGGEQKEEYRRPTAIESDQPGYDPWLDQYSAPESSFSEYTTVLPNSEVKLSGEETLNSDEQIAAKINRRLRQHDQLKAEDIKVVVNSSGQVTLEGRVDNPDYKQVAAEVISSVAGVSQIFNHLQVEPSQGQR